MSTHFYFAEHKRLAFDREELYPAFYKWREVIRQHKPSPYIRSDELQAFNEFLGFEKPTNHLCVNTRDPNVHEIIRKINGPTQQNHTKDARTEKQRPT